jgi:hypothetical protein
MTISVKLIDIQFTSSETKVSIIEFVKPVALKRAYSLASTSHRSSLCSLALAQVSKVWNLDSNRRQISSTDF